MAFKRCNTCELDLPLADFGLRKARGNRPLTKCRACISAYVKARRDGNLDRERHREREYRRANAQPAKARKDRFLAKRPGYLRNRMLVRTYGMTSAEWDALFEQQGCACAICKTSDPGRFWQTDHCHDGGHVRGILCQNCNQMLGFAKDSVTTLQTASAYLLCS